LEAILHESQSYKRACAHPRWKATMKQEYDLIINNGTWEFKDLSTWKNIVSNKWVFKKKINNKWDYRKTKSIIGCEGF
jgi:hypothetical protein